MKLINLPKINLLKKIIINLIIFLSIIFTLISFIILPTIKNINHIGSEIEIQKVDLEKKYIKTQNLKQISAELNKMEPMLSKLDQVFINKNNELDFITLTEKIATINNVYQKINLGSDQSIKNETYKKIPLQLSIQGDFINQLNYLISLESLNYYINIKSLELSKQEIDITNSKKLPLTWLNLKLIADTYWQ
ncbi:MAG: type 4a pilus biogenesis protein PilO [Patescibacteria group bacterium]|nr:type 4a pilus biogenesis protein PilO [Patescibacteria group bacterium]MBU1063095.1 type 4a pilus biogenesis protein PilO [Patescibacteria group bacterium]